MLRRWTADQIGDGRYHFLLEIEGAALYRLTTKPEGFSVSDPNGEEVFYTGGRLEVGAFTLSVDPFGDGSARARASIRFDIGESIPKLERRGYLFESARARLYQVYSFGAWDQRCLKLEGRLRRVRPDLNAEGFAASADLEAEDLVDLGEMIPAGDVLTESLWPLPSASYHYDTTAPGSVLPIPIGRPGAVGIVGESAVVDRPGCPGLIAQHSTGGADDRIIIARERITATSVRIWNINDQSKGEARTVSHETDGNGVSRAVVTPSTLNNPASGDEIWVSFGEDEPYGGIADPFVGPDSSGRRPALRGLGNVIRWALSKSRAAIDYGALLPLKRLNGLKIDGYVNTQIPPVDWVDAALAVFPIYKARGGRGLYYAAIPLRPRVEEAILRVEEEEGYRLQEYTTSGTVANVITLRYAPAAHANHYLKSITLTGASLDSDPDNWPADTEPSSLLKRSFQFYGELREELTSDYILDDATARSVLADQALLRAFPRKVITVSGPALADRAEPGDVASIYFPSFGLESTDGEPVAGVVIGKTLRDFAPPVLTISIPHDPRIYS
jgi:hypothetical protein